MARQSDYDLNTSPDLLDEVLLCENPLLDPVRITKRATISSLLAIGGAIVETTGTTFTASAAHSTILCNCVLNDITVNLPAAAGVTGHIYRIKKIDTTSNEVTIDGNGTETIDDELTATLNSPKDSVTIQSDGTEWWII